ncbi:MAG: MBL fold metallo-hydrolase [Bryobacteraceae bacterium]
MGSKISRRILVRVAGAAGLAVAAKSVYDQAPIFWRQWANDWKRRVPPPPRRPDVGSWGDRGLHIAWLGHATMLIRIDGFTILTDPVFSRRAGIHLGPVTIGVKRLVDPALTPDKLPPVDLVLVSHAHMDHLDIPSLRRMENPHTDLVTAHATGDLMRPERYRSFRELRWGQTAQAGPVSIRAIEVNHWGARVRTDIWRGYNGYIIESGRYRILFAGDTADTTLFRQLRSRRPFDVAMMPIGAYNPWIRFHCTPEAAWRMGNEAGAERVIPIHHQTFRLSNEPPLEPIERFREAVGREIGRVPLDGVGQEMHLA